MAGLTHDEIVDLIDTIASYRDSLNKLQDILVEYCQCSCLSQSDEEYDQRVEELARRLRQCTILIKKGDIL